jgi:predicted DCC family thiol-disulfide oxidoreductase YuxK
MSNPSIVPSLRCRVSAPVNHVQKTCFRDIYPASLNHPEMIQIPDNLVLFDGVCNLCTASVRFIIQHDRKAIFRFASIQSEIGKEICRSQGLDPADVQTFLLISAGKILLRSDAAIAVASSFGGLWRLLRVFKLVPRVARDWIYSTVARNRYRWFGRTDACMIPSPEVRDRFVG